MSDEYLQKALKDLAMKLTQKEYMEFISKPLVEANGEKSRIEIENFEKEHPEAVERMKIEFQRVYDAWKKDREEYKIELKNYVDKLKKEYETLNKQNLPKPNNYESDEND